ncbi:MAG: hypothetical protein WCW84_10235 [Sulfurimonas sp.]
MIKSRSKKKSKNSLKHLGSRTSIYVDNETKEIAAYFEIEEL